MRIFYKIEGKGSETLVAVHGGPGNSLESIRPDFGPLAKNRRVIYYDQRGQGRSELITDGNKLGYEQHVADLEALRKHFKLEKMALIGNSWGGLLVSLYAVAHPDHVERMILDSPAGPTRGFLHDMEDEISRRTAKLYTRQQNERARPMMRPEVWMAAKDLLAHCREIYTFILRTYTYGQTFDGLNFKGDVCAPPMETLRTQRTVNAHAWASLGDYNLMPMLGVVKAPVLVIHGVADVIPQKSSEFWAAGYPNARLFLIQKAGHMAQVETPDIFFPAIETFLKGTFPAEAKKVNVPSQNRAR
ncbi:MAG TPA: alpha/beta hydrolase [Pyrinomonadaceae bacterium]|nr:alpha/beta hydrolase [Pyrinomonadaceae bacterium]